MAVHVQNEEHPITNKVATSLYASGGILLKFELIQAFMHVLVLCMIPKRMKKIEPKLKAPEWPQLFSHYKFIVSFQDA